MNKVLDTTDTPFGKAVMALNFRRERLGAIEGAAPGCPRDTVLSHRALLRLPDGRRWRWWWNAIRPQHWVNSRWRGK
jgi:hypothetical protein